jgi:hypothetical protein
MLNHILRTLGLPKRTEINNTPLSLTLRKYAELEAAMGDHLEEWNEYTEVMKAVIGKLNKQVIALQRRVAKLERGQG